MLLFVVIAVVSVIDVVFFIEEPHRHYNYLIVFAHPNSIEQMLLQLYLTHVLYQDLHVIATLHNLLFLSKHSAEVSTSVAEEIKHNGYGMA